MHEGIYAGYVCVWVIQEKQYTNITTNRPLPHDSKTIGSLMKHINEEHDSDWCIYVTSITLSQLVLQRRYTGFFKHSIKGMQISLKLVSWPLRQLGVDNVPKVTMRNQLASAEIEPRFPRYIFVALHPLAIAPLCSSTIILKTLIKLAHQLWAH